MERELERLEDGEEFLIPLMIDLAREMDCIEIVERLEFGLKMGGGVRSVQCDNVSVDLVRMARFVVKKILAGVTGGTI